MPTPEFVSDPQTRPLVVLGEVRTCLVPDSAALSQGVVQDLLALVPGRRVVSRSRPVALASSPSTAIGVDCRLATASGTTLRAVGTAAAKAVVVGGRVLQSSVHTGVVRSFSTRRQAWSHYLGRAGVTEVLTRVSDGDRVGADLVEAVMLSGVPPPETLDLGSISEHLLRRVRMNAALDQRVPFVAETTRLRWAARVVPDAQPSLRFLLDDEARRCAIVTVGDERELAVVPRFCEDLALHDWLLTVVGAEIERADLLTHNGSESVKIVATMLEHVVHLWLPGAHSPAALRGVWRQLESDPGFSRQWESRIYQLRDRLSVATLSALYQADLSRTNW